MASTSPPLSLDLASKIAGYAIQTPEHSNASVELSQAEHRVRLLQAWHPTIVAGTRVLELGCGQGTCTQALVEAVGETGHVDAVDPGSLDYGAPFTLGQAQGHLSAGPVGSRITWHQADPVAFLEQSSSKTWDVAVLAHCIWYFESPEVLGAILKALKGRATTLCVAEYAFHASNLEAVPHVLSTLTRATLEAHRPVGSSSENIQTPLTPATIKQIASENGWTVQKESNVVPDAALDDGRWETGTVLGKKFLQTAGENIKDQRVMAVLQSARDAVVTAVEGIGGAKKVRTMDVWTAAFVSA